MAFNIKKYIPALTRPFREAINKTYDDAVTDASALLDDETIEEAKDEAIETVNGWVEDLQEVFEVNGEAMYLITFEGADTSSAAANVDISTKVPEDVTPAEHDRVVLVTGVATATGLPVAAPALVAADTADGIVIGLVSDGTIKVRFGRNSGANLTANTYTAWVVPYTDLS